MEIYAMVPDSTPNNDMDYEVDHGALQRMVAPCLTHMLDAAFSGIVIEGLVQRGIRDIVAIHDAWMVPFDSKDDLIEVIRDAGTPWFLSLEPVYLDLIRYLTGTTYEGWAQTIYSRWQKRCSSIRSGADHAPDFRRSKGDLLKIVRLEQPQGKLGAIGMGTMELPPESGLEDSSR